MPILPLGSGAHRRDDGIVPAVRCLNMYLEADESGISPDKTLRIQRPGLLASAAIDGPVRGLYYRTGVGSRLSVGGSTFYDNEVSKGSVPGAGIVPFTSNAFTAAFLAGVTAYLYDTSLTAVVMPDDAPGALQDIDQLNGYIILLCSTGRFYWIVPGATTVDALNFATAESSPDGALSVRRLGDELWFFGTDSVEVWQPTGDTDAPFQRTSGRIYERGCLARDAVRRFDNALVWVGDDNNVYRGAQVPQIISDPAIAERIRNRTSDVSAWVFGVDSHKFYVLHIPGQGDFAYDASTKEWPEFATGDGPGWAPWVGYEEQGVVYAGSSVTGDIWQVTPTATNDAGTPFTRLLTATVPINGKPPRNDSLSIGTGASADATIRVRWKDGQDDYPDYYDELPMRQGLDTAVMYRLGQPETPYRTFEISCTDDVRLRIAGAMANEPWGQ